MKKLILLSVIIASIAVPAHAARAKGARAGFKKMVVQTLIFNFLYLIAVLFVWSRV